MIATDAQGNVTFVNDCAAALTGWSPTEAIGKPLAKVFRTLDERTRRNSRRRARARGPGCDGRPGARGARRDRTRRRIEGERDPRSQRSPGGFVLVFRDTTEARRARAALEESEARFRVMADQTPVPLWMSDATRRYVYFNREWLAFTGRAANDELGDGWTTGVHPEDFGPRRAAYAEAFDARRPFTLEYRLRRHDGEYRWMLDHGAPRFDGDGSFAGYIGVCLDITERKEAAATLGDFEQRKSAFLASLAHELRNPLAPIRSSVELLQRMPVSDDPRVARAHDIIARQCARLAGLVDDLLDLSRIDAGMAPIKREPVDVASAIERAVARHAGALRDRRQTITVEAPRTPMRVEGDADRIEQMLAILIGNASKHTPAEGRLCVVAGPSGAAAEISVRDSGAGIEPDLQPVLFDLFDGAGDHAGASAASAGHRACDRRPARATARRLGARRKRGQGPGQHVPAAIAAGDRHGGIGRRTRREGDAAGTRADRRRQCRRGRCDRHAARARRVRGGDRARSGSGDGARNRDGSRRHPARHRVARHDRLRARAQAPVASDRGVRAAHRAHGLRSRGGYRAGAGGRI